MVNKLKDIFSNNLVDMGGNVRFKNLEAQQNFFDALDIVWEQGKTVEVDGISSVSTHVKSGKYIYPFLEANKVDRFIVGPSVESVPISLDTEIGKKTLQLKRFHTAKEIVLETDSKAIVYIKMRLNKLTKENTFYYRVQPEQANSIQEIVENYILIIAFMNYLFKDNESNAQEEDNMIHKSKKYFIGALDFYQRLHEVERELDLHFFPKVQNENCDDEAEFEQLYGLLYENKAFRINKKISMDEGINLTKLNDMNLTIGSKLNMVFNGNISFNIYGQNISLYTANLLTNAVVKEIKKEDGNIKVLCDDTDSEPMYISFTGFKLEIERDYETEILMGKIDKYINAITIDEYLRQKYANR